MRKLLVVNMNYLGDALMTTPVHYVLRRAFPHAEIDVIAGATNGYNAAQVLYNNPDINRVIGRASGGAFARCLQLFGLIRQGRYDAVLILPSIPAYLVASRLAGARTVFMVPRMKGTRHITRHLLEHVGAFLKLAGQGSLPVQEGATEPPVVLEVPPADIDWANRAFGHFTGPVVALNLGATRPQKRWPSEHFAQIIRQQMTRGVNVVLLGGVSDAEREQASLLKKTSDDTAGPVGGLLDLVGKTTIMQLAALVKCSSVIVTADTGAMHIASAVGTPQIALFGSTDPERSGPYDPTNSIIIYNRLACSPCDSRPTCNGAYTCMDGITPDTVGLKINGVLNRARTTRELIVAASGHARER